jgi:hypothetical protein
MPERKFDLGDYVEVKDRIKLFYELYAQGRLVTADVQVSSEPDGTPRVLVKALAYRTPDDPQPAVGWSWMVLPGTTSYTRGSELENTETSAWGRAIAATGILIDRSIASAQEVQNKEGAKPPAARTDRAFDNDTSVEVKVASTPPRSDNGLIGTAEVGKDKTSDFGLRKSGDDEHFALGFKLKSNGGGFKVLTRDELALQLLDVKDEVVGKRITVWGRVRDETFTPKGSGRPVTYSVIDAERIKTEAGVLPVMPKREPEFVPPILEFEEPIPVAEGQEPLFDLVESARLDAEEAARA